MCAHVDIILITLWNAYRPNEITQWFFLFWFLISSANVKPCICWGESAWHTECYPLVTCSLFALRGTPWLLKCGPVTPPSSWQERGTLPSSTLRCRMSFSSCVLHPARLPGGLVREGSLLLGRLARPWGRLPPPLPTAWRDKTAASIHRAPALLHAVPCKPQLFPHGFVLQ